MMTTPVLFRKSEGQITAVFPTLEASPGCMTCYAHIGQHGSCSMEWYYTTKAATPEEYADLLVELIGRGYDDLKVFKRLQRWMHLKRVAPRVAAFAATRRLERVKPYLKGRSDKH